METVIFRPFRPQDLDALFVLDFRSYPQAYRFGYQQLLRTLQDRNVSAMVIEDEAREELVGALLVRANPQAGEVAVVSLMVERDCRRQGLGRRLLDWAAEYARTSGWQRVVVPVERGNEGAAAFLAATGYADSGRAQPYFQSAGEGTTWLLAITGEGAQ